jgi:cellulose synthase (UDP-forming)
MIFSISAYAVAVALALFALIMLGYKPRTEINKTFDAYRRTPALRKTVTAWFVVLGATFLFVQGLRLPFYKYVFSELAQSATLMRTGWEPVHALGMLLLLLCEWLVLMHWLVYVYYCWRATHRYELPRSSPLNSAPEVLVMIACCDEEPEVLERSVSTAMLQNYPNYRAFLIENSRDERKKQLCAAVAERFGMKVLHVSNRGHKAGALNDALPKVRGDAKYVAVFDVDHTINPNALSTLVPLLENDEQVAFVQTPQLYENAEQTWTTRAAAMQEMLLYDSIMEAKGSYERALCCGSNFVMRIDALESVGGWDEETVSEDLMTSFLIHKKGWKSLYHRTAFAIGLGPNTVYGYWKQQRRWATGNTSVAKRVFRQMFGLGGERARFGLAADYLWSAGYYFVTLALAYLATVPMLLLLLIRFAIGGQTWYLQETMRPVDWLYLSVYPLYVAVALFPYVHMRLRGYSLRNLVLLQGLLANTVPIYVISVLRGVFQQVKFFVVVPKKAVQLHKPFWRTPQSYIFVGLLVIGGLLFHMVRTENVAPFVYILLFWTLFYTLSFAHFFIFTIESRRVVEAEARGE